MIDEYERFGIYAALSAQGVVHVSDDPPRAYCGKTITPPAWIETHLLIQLDPEALSDFRHCKTCTRAQVALMRQHAGA